jgi:hypothetical protein
VRRVVLVKFCGVEWVEDRREVEATVSLAYKGRDLDLCEEHADRIPIKLIEEAAQKYGTPAEAGKAKPKAPKVAEVKYPSEAEADGRIPCGFPGCDYKHVRPASLGIHRRRKHGIAGSSDTSKRRFEKVAQG